MGLTRVFGRSSGQVNYILSLMFYKRLCDQWECEADDAELEKQQGRTFTERQKSVFRKYGEPTAKRLRELTGNCAELLEQSKNRNA